MAEPAVFAELGPSLFVLVDFRPSQECGQRFDVISLWCGLSPLSFPCRDSLQTHTCVSGGARSPGANTSFSVQIRGVMQW